MLVVLTFVTLRRVFRHPARTSAGKMQVDCERDLAAAIPAVEKAEAALNNIDRKGLLT